MLAHVPSFGRNPRGSPDFLAYPVPKACMHVLGTWVPRRLGVARSASSPKAALALGCSLTPGLRISFGRVTCMARAASVPGLWALGFLLLACVCGWVRVAFGGGFCLPLPVVAGVLGGCVWARFVVLSLFCRPFVVFVVGLWCRPAFGTCVVSCVFPLPSAVSGFGVRCGRACWARVSAVPRPSWLGCRAVFFALFFFFFRLLGVPVPGLVVSLPVSFLSGWAAGFFFFFLSACFGAPFPAGPLFLAWCRRFWLGGPPVPVWGSCLRCPLGGGFGPLLCCWRRFGGCGLFSRAHPPPPFFWGGGGGGGLAVPPFAFPRLALALWLVCGVVGPSPLLAEVPVCYSPPLLAGFRCRWWWAAPATPGWGLPAAVVCGGGVLVGLWLVCGVVGPSPLLAEVPVCYSPPLLAGFRCRLWWAVPATPGWGLLAAVVCGVWCVAVVCWWGCGWCVVWLVPRHSWRRFLCATPRHSWLGFAAGGGGRSPPLLAGVRLRWWCVVCGVWCVVCGVWRWCVGGVVLVCGVVGPSPLLAVVPVCYSPPLLAGFRCRWWWAVPATPGWGLLAAWCVVCGVWCVAVVCWWGCGWCVVWLVPRHSWRRFLCATPRHSWLGFAAGGGGRSPPLLVGVRLRRWCVVCGVWCVVCGVWRWCVGGVVLVCGVVGPSPLLAVVPVCYSPPLLAGFRCRWWWAVPATPGWGPLAAVVCVVWCVSRWCVGGVVAGVWCGWSLATPGGGSCVLLPATPGWVSLPVVLGGPRHSWLGSAGGVGLWCVAVVCCWGCGWCVVWLVPRHSWRRSLCATPRHSWLGFAAAGGGRSPQLLAGVRWRRWCACFAWPGRAGRPPGRVLVRLTLSFGRFVFLLCLAPSGLGLPLSLSLLLPFLVGCFSRPPAAWLAPRLCLPLGRWLLFGCCSPAPPHLCVWRFSSLLLVAFVFFFFSLFVFLRAPPLSLAFSGFRPRVPWASALALFVLLAFRFSALRALVPLSCFPPGCWLLPRGCCPPPPLVSRGFCSCRSVLCAVLCCACLGAVLRRAAACCVARCCAVVCCVALAWCRCLLRRALWRCPSPWGPVLCGAVFCGVPPRCVLCAVCVLSWRGGACCCSPLCLVLCVSRGAVLCVPCALRSVRCCASLCWCARVVLFVWCVLLLAPGAVVRCCVLCCFLWCAVVRCWVWWPVVVCWWRVSVSVSLSGRVVCFPVVGVVCCGALLSCVVFCGAVLSRGAVLLCSAVVLRCCWGLLCPPVGRRAVLCCAVGWLCCFWPGGGVCVLWCSFPRAVRSLSSPLCALRCLVVLAVVPCFPVSCAVALCCRVVLCCRALLSFCGAVCVCFALLRPVVRRPCGLRCCWCLVLWRVPVRCGVSLGVLRCGGAALVCRGVLLCCALSCGVLRSVPCPAVPCCPAVLCWLAVLCGCLRFWCLFCPLFFCLKPLPFFRAFQNSFFFFFCK